MDNFDVIVIGAGAAGLMAAGRAGELGLSVCLIEKKSRPGIKLSITGKGRCNITNSAQIHEFIAELGPNGKFLFSAFNKFFNGALISFFEKHGVQTKLERGGRYFPLSDDAHSIVNALIKYAKENNVKIKTSAEVVSVKKENRTATEIVLANGETLKAKKYIIATGGLSYPQTGSTGDGYKFARIFGHTITEPSPALVPVTSQSPYLKTLNGLKIKNSEITLFADGKMEQKLFGDFEFTSFGMTGPVILTLSGDIFKLTKENKKVEISVNLKPGLDDKTLDMRLVRELNSFGSMPVKQMLREMIPMAMIEPFMKINGINATKKCSEVSKIERGKLLKGFQDLRFEITGTRQFNEAIITKGGISVSEIEQATMKSKLADNVFFCGEILDLDGPTGGFNLQIAFSTGYLAGSSLEV